MAWFLSHVNAPGPVAPCVIEPPPPGSATATSDQSAGSDDRAGNVPPEGLEPPTTELRTPSLYPAELRRQGTPKRTPRLNRTPGACRPQPHPTSPSFTLETDQRPVVGHPSV